MFLNYKKWDTVPVNLSIKNNLSLKLPAILKNISESNPRLSARSSFWINACRWLTSQPENVGQGVWHGDGQLQPARLEALQVSEYSKIEREHIIYSSCMQNCSHDKVKPHWIAKTDARGGSKRKGRPWHQRETVWRSQYLEGLHANCSNWCLFLVWENYTRPLIKKKYFF